MRGLIAFVLLIAVAFPVASSSASTDASRPLMFPAMSLSHAVPPTGVAQAPATQPVEKETTATTTTTREQRTKYRGVNDWFQVREAYSDVQACEWLFGVGYVWTTGEHRRDWNELKQVVKYGITDTLHVSLGVSEPLGYGGDGVMESNLTVFNTFWDEGDILPAFGGYASMRIPTGSESNGVDGKFGGIFTKEICPGFRAHFEGWVATVNGQQGHIDDWFGKPDYQHFQWALGPGFDVALGEDTLLLMNFLHGNNPVEGQRNYNTVEFGVVHRFGETANCYHLVKVATDLNLHQEDPYRLGAKLAWEIYLK